MTVNHQHRRHAPWAWSKSEASWHGTRPAGDDGAGGPDEGGDDDSRD